MHINTFLQKVDWVASKIELHEARTRHVQCREVEKSFHHCFHEDTMIYAHYDKDKFQMEQLIYPDSPLGNVMRFILLRQDVLVIELQKTPWYNYIRVFVVLDNAMGNVFLTFQSKKVGDGKGNYIGDVYIKEDISIPDEIANIHLSDMALLVAGACF